MSRSFRTAITMAVLVGVLVGLAYFGWRGLTRGWFTEDSQATANVPAQTCTTPPPVRVRSADVRVSVYNAGAPAGQAGAVMDALTGQGFREGEVADAPDGLAVDGIVLSAGDTDPGAVKLVQRQFRDARVVRRGQTLGPGVNVLVGEDFDRLARRAPRTIEIARPQVCGQGG